MWNWTNFINGSLLIVILGYALYLFRSHHDPKSLRIRACRAIARAESIEAMRAQRDKSERLLAENLGLNYADVATRLFRNAPQANA